MGGDGSNAEGDGGVPPQSVLVDRRNDVLEGKVQRVGVPLGS